MVLCGYILWEVAVRDVISVGVLLVWMWIMTVVDMVWLHVTVLRGIAQR